MANNILDRFFFALNMLLIGAFTPSLLMVIIMLYRCKKENASDFEPSMTERIILWITFFEIVFASDIVAICQAEGTMSAGAKISSLVLDFISSFTGALFTILQGKRIQTRAALAGAMFSSICAYLKLLILIYSIGHADSLISVYALIVFSGNLASFYPILCDLIRRNSVSPPTLQQVRYIYIPVQQVRYIFIPVLDFRYIFLPVHHQQQLSDNYLDASSNGQWLQSAGLQHLQSSLPPSQDFGYLGGVQGSRVYRGPQRSQSGGSDVYAEPLTPPGASVAANSRRRNGDKDGVSPNEYSPGLLDLHSFDTELLPQVYTMKPHPLRASRDILRLMLHTYRNQGFQLFVSFFERYGGKRHANLNSLLCADRVKSLSKGGNVKIEPFVSNMEEIMPLSSSSVSPPTSSWKKNMKTGVCTPSCFLTPLPSDKLNTSRSVTEKGEPSTRFCVICNELKPPKGMQHPGKCNHYFCIECVKEYVVKKVKESGLPVECPGKGCKMTLPDNFNKFIPQEMLDRYYNSQNMVKALESSSSR